MRMQSLRLLGLRESMRMHWLTRPYRTDRSHRAHWTHRAYRTHRAYGINR